MKNNFIVSWYEDNKYLYSQGLFNTVKEAEQYAKENFANQTETSDDRSINQKELVYEVEVYDEETYEDLRIVK